MNKKIITIIYILIFFLIAFYNLNIIGLNYDGIWQYSFSYSFIKGGLPYKDFNTIVPPFSLFIMSIPLIIKNSYASYVLFHSLLLTISLFFSYKMFKEKTFILLILLFIFPVGLLPNYNSIIFMIFILILYFENTNYKYKDYIIGLLIALSILSKQSIGIFFLLPTIIYKHKDINCLKKRIIGFTIPNIIFLIYLIKNKILYNFIDLCFLGLSEFKDNFNGSIFLILLFIIMLIISIFLLLKDKDNISYLYCICLYSMAIPLFNITHLVFPIFAFLIIILDKIKIKRTNYVTFICIFIYIFITSIYFVSLYGKINYLPKEFNHFEYININNNLNTERIKVIKYLKNKKYIMYDLDAAFYRISLNKKTNFLDIPLHGNFGKNNNKKIIFLIEKSNAQYILVNKKYNKNFQLDKVGIKYIKDNYQKIDEVSNYYIYKK